MDGKKLRKIFFAAVTALVIAVCSLTFGASGGAAYANSAQRHWSGTNSSGVGVRGENCPLEVESEILTFDIHEFPSNYYSEERTIDNYNARVTAEYHFYNPADYDVTATLAFPFGHAPAYLQDEKFDEAAKKYTVTVNGEAVKTTLRFTDSNGNFDLSDIDKIRDDYDNEGFYKTDLPVTAYTFRFSGIDDKTYPAATAAIEFKAENVDKTKYIVMNANSYHNMNSGCRIGVSANNGDKIVVYVLGENVSITADRWTIYTNGGMEKPMAGTATLESTVATTLADLIFENYDENGNITRVDYFNAVADKMKRGEYGGGCVTGIPWQYEMRGLLRWYEYEMTVPAGGRAVNVVTAPVFPSIDTGRTPAVYEYEYLLSPASTWAKFGTLEIVINTPYYIYDYPKRLSSKPEQDKQNWTKTETGYVRNLDALPDGELKFRLCSEETTSSSDAGKGLALIFLFVLFYPLIVIGVLVVSAIVGSVLFALIYGGVRKKKREKNGVKTGLGANKPSDYFGDYGSYPDVPQEKKPDRGEQAKTDNLEDGEINPKIKDDRKSQKND